MVKMIRRQNYVVTCYNHNQRYFSKTTRIIANSELSAPAYRPEVVERHKYEKWVRDGRFACSNGDKTKPTLSMILPPPNVTGKLHLGHALSGTVQDVIARRYRSLGHNVLWLPGTDHAGLATQGVVEKYIKSKNNISRFDMGRETFIKEVEQWKQKYGDSIYHQLMTLGFSLDWPRRTFTMDPKITNAVNTAFVTLFEKGLIYRSKALVNWCSALKSTVSDIEVDHMNIDGPTDVKLPGQALPVRFGMLYSFAYKVLDSEEEVVVSTTMPETMLGDTAVAVHPDDERYGQFKDKHLVHPFNRKTIPIIFDDLVNMEFGTGAVKITPAHSRVDYEISQQHGLPMQQVIDEDGMIENSPPFNKLDIYTCRELIIKKLQELGLLRDISPHQMVLPICKRTGDVINFLPKEQWFLSCSVMNNKAAEAATTGELEIIPEKYVKNFTKWTEEDRDWCISRQSWWGHQIPAYKCTYGADSVWVPAHNEADAKSKASVTLKALPGKIKCERDPDVLDTWFSSGIYPFAALGWPNHTPDYNDFYPLSLMSTGHDILGFWVHRMVILGLELTGKLPFKKVLLHGVICDQKGAKMSKSKGNVIDPLDVVSGIKMSDLQHKYVKMHERGIISKEELAKASSYVKSNFGKTDGIPACGSDALRFTLLNTDIKSHFVNFDLAMCNSNKLFCNKIWQAVRYVQLTFSKLKPLKYDLSRNDLNIFDRWILSRLACMVNQVNTSMDEYDFHLATKALKKFIHNDFCDLYLESTKPAFNSQNIIQSYGHAHTLSAVLNTSLRCLSPFMVFLADELIPKVPCFLTNVIVNYNDIGRMDFEFPQANDFNEWKDELIERRVNKLLNCIRLIREMRGIYGIPNGTRPLVRILSKDKTFGTDVDENMFVIVNMTQCKDVMFETDENKRYVSASLSSDTTVLIEMLGEDIDKAIAHAQYSIQKRVKNLEESLNKIETKILNLDYKENAPKWAQMQDKEMLETKKKQLEELQKLIMT